MQWASLILGVLVLAGAWFGPLPRLAEGAFFAHMILHMGVVAVAAPLIAAGVAGGKLDPARKYPGIFSPILASVWEMIVVWAWHAPALHHFARHTVVGFAAEQGTFLFTGLLLWLSVFGGAPSVAANRGAMGVAALLLTSMHMTLLGALLALTPRALYAHGQPPMELTALTDQQLGGAIMILVGAVVYPAGGLWLMIGLLRARPIQQEAGS